MAALRNRTRLARLIERGATRVLAAVTAGSTNGTTATGGSDRAGGLDARIEAEQSAEAKQAVESSPMPASGMEPGAAALYARELPLGFLGVHRTGVSQRLYDRLDAADLATVEGLVADRPELRSLYESTKDPGARRHMLLAFGVSLGLPELLEKTGLPAIQPPEEIHAMARGPISAAGGLYEADLLSDALLGVGVGFGEIRDAFDFGCSSGRVLRVLAAAHPEIAWHGCDPNAPAIAWAKENLPGIDFFVSDNAPPLPLEDTSLDLAYAISIWSHFAPDLAMRWFEEMRRIIRPGGYLVFTTHGFTSVAYYAANGLRTPQQSEAIVGSLYRHGWWYLPEFGADGDWGVVNPDWGTAFLSSEWVLAQLCPRWRVLDFAAGRNLDNQDVYVLQRV
jgi:SAM-dependent methyltransferase